MLTNELEDNVFRALADGTRRRIVRRLARSPQPVHAIASDFAVSRPAVSRHLKILKDAQLVDVAGSGRENVYFLKTSTLRQVEDWLGEIWATKLAILKALAEEDANV